jgi:predicted dehydrogenase
MAGQPRIAQVTRARITARRAGEVDSYALSEGVSEDDIRFVWECSWGMPDGLARYDLIGDGGSLRINLIPSPFGSNLIRKDRAGNETTLDAGIAPAELRASHFLSEVGYVNQLQEFRDAFASNRRPRVDAELGYHTLQVLAAGYLSARTERAVAVDDRLPSDQLLGEL